VQNEDIFADDSALSSIETMISCESIAWQLLDCDMTHRALPLLALMDYLATDVLLSNPFSMRAKLMSSIALSHIG